MHLGELFAACAVGFILAAVLAHMRFRAFVRRLITRHQIAEPMTLSDGELYYVIPETEYINLTLAFSFRQRSPNEGFPPDWVRVDLMVSPSGEVEAIGGDRLLQTPNQLYVGLERLRYKLRIADAVAIDSMWPQEADGCPTEMEVLKQSWREMRDRLTRVEDLLILSSDCLGDALPILQQLAKDGQLELSGTVGLVEAAIALSEQLLEPVRVKLQEDVKASGPDDFSGHAG
jgi:hypothetical protein